MITTDSQQARDLIMEATSLDYSLCQLIRRFHPVGQALVTMPIIKAQANGRKIQIHAAPQMAVEAFESVSMRYGTDNLAQDLLAGSKAFGVNSIFIGQYGVETDSPLDISTLNSNAFFNVVDPLTTAGSNTANQRPNYKDFLTTPSIIKVQGIGYHSSRCFTLRNPFEPSLFLNFNTAAFSYAPASCYERPLPYLKMFLENDLALSAGNKKVGSFIHKKAFSNQTALDAANQSIKGFIRQKLSTLFSGDVAIIGKDDEITTVDLMHFSESLNATYNAIIDRISLSSSDGIPASMLKGALLSTGLSDGTNDKEKEDECIIKHQKALEPIYGFLDPLMMRIAWNDPDFYAAIQARYPEYRGVSHRSAVTQWVNSFQWEWNPITEPTDAELADINEKKMMQSQQLIQLAQGLQLDEDVLLDLFESHVNNLNDLEILPNRFDIDVDSIRLDKIEQRLIGNDAQPAPQQIEDMPQ
ncbi:Protein of unknown function DUF1073 [uncultured Caudovirales phage]|uniref:DUF1073 domain-containing protein n=1 Tax=uncultured Caudovirales phage TaxID=2100421 RepID=A0A6J5LC18_9CAUD|nr:Protein of unknown function DUF1073 [uncultured Caudovirales phage]